MDAAIPVENQDFTVNAEKSKKQKLLGILHKGLIATKYGLELSDNVLESGLSMAGSLVLTPVVAKVAANVAVTGLKIGVDRALDAVKKRMEK